MRTYLISSRILSELHAESTIVNDPEEFRWRLNWVGNKIRLAERLAEGGCGGGYPEAAMVLCAVLSALAAELWPGKGKDRNRFVELLARHTPPSLRAATISIPLLMRCLQERGLQDEEAALSLQWLNVEPSKVIYGSDVDTTEEDIARLCPSLPLSMVRKFSYATLLYEEIRSGYVHEYATASRSDSFPMGQRSGDDISYINRINQDGSHGRLIYFSPHWMANLARSAELLSRGTVADEHFSNWWLSR